MKILLRKAKNISTQTNLGNSKTLQDIAFRVLLQFGKKVKINKVTDIYIRFYFERQLCSAPFVIHCVEQMYKRYKIQILVVKSI